MRALTLIAAATLAGCAQMQPAPAPRPPDPTGECFAQAQSDSAYDVLAGKVPRNGKPTLQMMADDSRPNEAEKAALARLYDNNERCVDAGRSWRTTYIHPTLIPLGERALAEKVAIRAALYRGEITFGQYNTQRMAVDARLQEQWAEQVARLRGSHEEWQRQQAAAEQARRQEAAMWLLQHPPAPQVLTPLPVRQPSTTNCVTIGNQIHCTTQ